MTNGHLIHLGQPGNEEHDKAVRAKLKGSASDKRKMAQRIAGLRRSSPETVEQKALQLISGPKISSLEIMRMIQVLKERSDLSDTLQVMLIGKAIDAHKAIFGTKSINLNMELKPESSKSIHEIYLEVISNGKSNESTTESNKSESDNSSGPSKSSDSDDGEGDSEEGSDREER